MDLMSRWSLQDVVEALDADLGAGTYGTREDTTADVQDEDETKYPRMMSV